jgi:predicted membrane channel-forming protein YqfA (hemolysin III family)
LSTRVSSPPSTWLQSVAGSSSVRFIDEGQLRKKHDRELIELLNEIRIVLPGAQVLFAFLLIVPFNSSWTATTRSERTLYYLALFATLVSTTLLMAPTSYHRLRWRERDKERMLQVCQRLTIAGMIALAVAMIAAVGLVSEEVLGSSWAIVFGAAAAVVIGLAWFALPLSTPYDRWDAPSNGGNDDVDRLD